MIELYWASMITYLAFINMIMAETPELLSF